MRRKSVVAATAAAATALAVLGLAGPAQAADAIVTTTYNDGYMSYVDRSNDTFKLGDTSHDGYAIRGWLYSGGGTQLKTVYHGGDEGGSTETIFSYDLAKGKSYIMRVCLVSSSSDTTPINCESKTISDS